MSNCWICRRNIKEVEKIVENQEPIQMRLAWVKENVEICAVCKLIIRSLKT